MQGNKVLTGNVIILTHVRPIHKTTGVPEPAQGAGLGLSPELGGSRCCCGKDSFPWLSGRGSVLFVKRGKKNIFFLKKRVPDHCGLHASSQRPIAKAPLQTKEFCKPFALFRRETRPSPGTCVFICPPWQSGPCCGLDPSLFSDTRGCRTQD